MHRRSFLAAAAIPSLAMAQSSVAREPVSFSGDGVQLAPQQYVKLLSELLANGDSPTDRYLEGGAVEKLEARFAKLLGKPAAVFLPTGTMANHLAVRLLAGDKRRVLVQSESHLYRDENDCAELFSGLNLVALAPNRATFPFAEYAAAVSDSSGPPYPMPIGALSIESPVRRRRGEVFDFSEMKKITSDAKTKGIGTHLDGARVFLASGYTGIAPAEYASLFDTAYVSLYKYFNAPFGAILAGPKDLIAKVPVLRRQLGGGLLHAWEPAIVAMHYLDGFEQRYKQAVSNGKRLVSLLESTGRFKFEQVPNGSNIMQLSVTGAKPDIFREKLRSAGIAIATSLQVQINETINRRPVEEIVEDFRKAALA